MPDPRPVPTRGDHRRLIGRLAALFLAACAVLAVFLIKPAVPHTIRMLAGPEGSTFHQDALGYKEHLEEHGVTVIVEETAGSLENLQRLAQADEPTVAFADAIEVLRGGNPGDERGMESLGALYLQPVWLFSQRGAGIDDLRDLRGNRLAPGRKGSGARLIAVFLLESTGIEDEVEIVQTKATGEGAALAALETGRVGAVVASGEPDSKLIDSLLRAPQVQPWSIQRAEAIAARYPFLKQVRYPEGVHDLETNIPSEDLTLLASGTELLVSAPFPPALSDLLLEAATEIHGSATLFSEAGDFPNPHMASMPLSSAARHYYTDGRSKLQKFLPFRLATLVDRFLWLAVGAATAAVAIFSLLPRLLSLRFNLNLNRAYRRLEVVEKAAAGGQPTPPLVAELNELEESTATLRVPMRSLAPAWFELRQNIHDVRDRVEPK